MMQSKMIHTDRVLIVEGKYDAVRLAHLTGHDPADGWFWHL